MNTMRAIRLTGVEQFELATVPVPEPSAGEVLVAIDVCGVCGSDVHLVDGSMATDLPVILGHEAAGRVAALGEGVTGIEVGTRVAVLPYVGCGTCQPCRTDQVQACARRQVLGVDLPGAQADHLVVPTECLIPLPDAVPSDLGAIITDAVATPYHAIRQAEVVAGESAVVFGLGGLGMHAAAILTEVVGATVYAVDPRPTARELAARIGVRAFDTGRASVAAILAETGGGADAAFEFVGHPDVVSAAMRTLRPRGRCVVVGVGPDRLALNVRQETLVGRELRLFGSFGATRAEVAELVDLVAAGRLDLSGSVGASYPPERFAAALAETRDKGAGAVRVVVDYR
jgi:D-arabinose 1-dehydrogenase-like Zn-dependent alcohol dehydrogenase